MSDVDQLILCPVCNTYKHSSWFSVGNRGCHQCTEENNAWVEGIADMVKQMDEADAKLPTAMVGIVLDEAKPDAITAHQWRILHLLNRGIDDQGIAITHGVSVASATRMKEEALTALYTESLRREAEEADEDESPLILNRKQRRERLQSTQKEQVSDTI